MGWITISDEGTLDYRAMFAILYPNAVVVVSDTDSGIVAAVYEVGAKVCKIYAVQHVTVTEYRGLSHSAAVRLKKGVAVCSKVAYRTEDGSSWAVVPMLVGVERTASISRANDADGYKLTVTETTIAQSDVTASWETGTSA